MINLCDAIVDVVRQRFFFLLGRDITLFFHIVQNFFTAFRILLRELDRIVAVGILCDTSDDSTFGQCQVADIFIKVSLGSLLNTEAVRP